MNTITRGITPPFSLCAGNHRGIAKEGFHLEGDSIGSAKLTATANVATGNLVLRDRLLRFAELGGDIEFAYYCNSLPTLRWNLGYASRIKLDKNNKPIALMDVSGYEVQYEFNANTNTYKPKAAQDGLPEITYDAERKLWCVFKPATNVREYYGAGGFILERVDGAGNKTTFEYDPAGHYVRIKPASGVVYEIRRTKKSVSIVVNDKVVHTYELGDAHELLKSKTADGYETAYVYQNNLIKEVQQTDGAILKLDYYPESETNKTKLKSIQLGNEAEVDKTNINLFEYEEDKTILTDAIGIKKTLLLDAKNVSEIQEERGIKLAENSVDSVKFEYNKLKQIKRKTYPDGTFELFAHRAQDGLINEITHRDKSITFFHYLSPTSPLLHTKVELPTEPNENPPRITRYIYDVKIKSHPRFIISPTGCVKEYILNEKSGVVDEIREYPRERYTVSAKANEVPTLKQMETWVANIKQKGGLKQLVSIKQRHDKQGRLNHKEGAAYCDENGVSKGDGADYVEDREHDLYGHVQSQKIKCDENVFAIESAKFNNNGDKINEKLGAGSAIEQETTQQYTKNTLVKTLPNGRVETATLSAQGMIEAIVTKVGDVERVQRVERDRNGEVMAVYENNIREISVYDRQHRLIYSISALGAVTKYDYSRDKNFQLKTQYATAIDTTKLYVNDSKKPDVTILESLLQKNALEDRVVHTFKGPMGELRYEIDGGNYLTEYRYNAFGEPFAKIIYAEKVSEQEKASLLNGQAINRIPVREVDAISATFTDADGYCIAEQDPAGYVVEYVRDAAHNIIEKKYYDEPVNLLNSDFTSIKTALKNVKTASTRCFYNGLKQLVLEVDAADWITSYDYYPDGKIKSSTRFDKKVDEAWLNNPTTTPTPAKTAGRDQTTQFRYDELRRQISVKHPSGMEESFAYDKMDHCLAAYKTHSSSAEHVTGDNCRGNEAKTNGWGEEVERTNAFVSAKLYELKNKKDTTAEKIDAVWKQYADKAVYDTNGLKTKTTNALQKPTIYYYNLAKKPVLAIGPGGAVTQLDYNTFGEITRETKYYNRISQDKLKNLTGGFYNDALLAGLIVPSLVKDKVTTYTKDRRGMTVAKNESGLRITECEYDALKRLCIEKLPVKTKDPTLEVAHKLDVRGLEIVTTKTADKQTISTSAEFKNRFGKPTLITNAIGGTQRNTYNALGLLEEVWLSSESGVDIRVKKIKYDAFNRPIEITNAVDKVTCYQYSDDGLTVTTILPDKKTTASSSSNIFAEILSIQNGTSKSLLAAHAFNGEVASQAEGDQKTEVKHDLLGRKEEVTTNGERTINQFNSEDSLEGVRRDADGLNIQTKLEPNAFGFSEKNTDMTSGIETTRVANQLDQVKEITVKARENVAGDVEEKAEYCQNNQNEIAEVKNINPTGHNYQENHDFDGFNRLIATTVDQENVNAITKFEHDAMGNIVAETDPNHHVIRKIYNKQGQHRFELQEQDCEGKSPPKQLRATEWEYTLTGKIKSMRVYHFPVDFAAFNNNFELNTLKTLFKCNKNDTVIQYLYDENDREKYKIHLTNLPGSEELTAIIEKFNYDTAGRICESIKYYQSIPATNRDTWTSESVVALITADPEKDVSTYLFYDDPTQERFKVTSDGRITETQYDKHGKPAVIIVYEKPMDALPCKPGITAADFAALVATYKGDARTTYFVRDNLGRLIYEVLPNGALTRRVYDSRDNTVEVCKFTKPFSPQGNYEEVVKSLNQCQPTAEDALTKAVYNNQNKEIEITDALGNADKYKRDGLGNAIEHTNRRGFTSKNSFNSAKRLTNQFSPETTVSEVGLTDKGQLTHVEKRAEVNKESKFDGSGNTKIIIEGKGTNQERKVHLSYNAQNKVIKTCVHNKFNPANKDKNAILSQMKLEGEPFETLTLYNTRDQIVAERNENKLWKYYIRDSAGRVIYEIHPDKSVIEYAYNAFDKPIKSRTCAINQDLSGLTVEELTLDNIKSKIIYNDDKDRISNFVYDRSNNLTQITKSKIIYHYRGVIDEGEPEEIFEFDNYGNCIHEKELIAAGVWAEKFFWHDKAGNLIAEVDEDGNLTTCRYDVHGNEVFRAEFKGVNWQGKNPKTMSVNEMEALVDFSDPEHRFYITKYNLLGHPVVERQTNYAISDYFKHVKSPATVAKEDQYLTEKSNEYSETEKLLKSIYEDGNYDRKYYDERDIKIAEVGITCTVKNPEQPGKRTQQLKRMVPNVFGQIATIQTSSEGGDLSDGKEPPKFLNPQKVDEENVLHENRGLALLTQKPDGFQSGTTYTGTKKPETNYQETQRLPVADPSPSHAKTLKDMKENNGAPPNVQGAGTAPHGLKSVKQIDKTVIAYNEMDEVKSQLTYRNNNLEESKYENKDSTGQVVAAGATEKDLSLTREIDKQGQPWKTVASGQTTIALSDLRGKETLSMQTPKQDSSGVPYNIDEFRKLLNLPANELLRTQTDRTPSGKEADIRHPIWFREKLDAPTLSLMHDRWGNVVKTLDAFLNETKNKYTHLNKLKIRIQPKMPVTGEDGETVEKETKTIFSHNVRGFLVSIEDEDHNVEHYALNEAGSIVTHFLPNETPTGYANETYVLNANQQPELMFDAHQKKWLFKYNYAGQIIYTENPVGLYKALTMDGYGALHRVLEGLKGSEHLPSGARELIYNNDARSNVYQSVTPDGKITTIVVDRNHQDAMTIYHNGLMLQSCRDDHGNLQWFTDLNRSKFNVKYDFAKQKISEASEKTLQIEMYKILRSVNNVTHQPHFETTLQTTGKRDIEYVWEWGYLSEMRDKETGLTVKYKTDQAGRRTGMKIIDAQGLVLQDITITLNAQGMPTQYVNVHQTAAAHPNTLTMDFKYDSRGNRRCVRATLDIMGYKDSDKTLQVVESWNLFDKENRLKVSDGYFDRVNKVIRLGKGQGCLFSYNLDLKTQEEWITPAGNRITAVLDYLWDKTLDKTTVGNFITTRKNALLGWLSQYSEQGPYDYKGKTSLRTLQYVHEATPSGETTSTNLSDNILGLNLSFATSETTYSNPDSFGQPQTESTVSHYFNYVVNTVSRFIYGRFMTAPVVQMSSKSTITQKEQTKETSAGSRELYDTNFQLNAKENAEDEKKTNAYFQSTPNGVIGKFAIRPQSDDGKNKYNNTTVDLYLPDLDMNPIAVYSSTSNEYNPWPEQNKFPATTMLSLPDRVLPIARRTFSDYPVNNNDPLKLNNLINPQMGPRYYIVQRGDSLESIAQLFKVNVKDLARLNGYNENTTLLAGHELKLPCSIPVYNKFNSHVSYQNFINAIRGSLFPHLPLPHVVSPHHHHEFVNTLIKVIAIGILLYAAPAIATALLTSATGVTATAGLTLNIATAAVGAIEDAVVQNVAIGLGIQNKFSYAEMLETGVTAGMGGVLEAAPNIGMKMLDLTMSQVSTQLFELSLGLRPKFDAGAIATQLASFGVSYKLNNVIQEAKLTGVAAKTASYAQRAADTLAPAVLGKAITNTPIKIENLAANAIGSAVKDRVIDAIKAPSNLHPEVGAPRPKVATPPRKIGPKYENQSSTNSATRRFIDDTERTAISKLSKQKQAADKRAKNIASNLGNAKPNNIVNNAHMSDASVSSMGSTFMHGVDIFNSTVETYVAPAIEGAALAVVGLAASEVLIPAAIVLADTVSVAGMAAMGVPIAEGAALNNVAGAAGGAYILNKGVNAVGARLGSMAVKNVKNNALVSREGIFAKNFFGGATEKSALRKRVLGNIATSKAGRTERNIENFAIYDAKEGQIMSGYNADTWRILSLQKGDLVYGGLPGQSAFYTTEKTLLESGFNREKLFQSLQVKADPIRGYRSTVGVYEVTQNMRVPAGVINANLHLGAGGGEQFLIKNFNSTLKLIKTLELGESYEFMPTFRANH